jgi:phosphatidylglycerophosphatase A
MADKPQSGELFGVPYNFERPSLGRMLSSYWQPGEGMLVEKPFGVGYTLNLANWRSWVVLLVAGGLFYQQQKAAESSAADGDDDPVEVLVDE